MLVEAMIADHRLGQMNPVRDVEALKSSGILVHLKPGQSKSVKATLTKRYMFDESSAGEYELTVPKSFHVLTSMLADRLSSLEAEVDAVSFHYKPSLVRRRKRNSVAVTQWWTPGGKAGDFIDDATYERVGAGALQQERAPRCTTNLNYLKGVAGISKQALRTSLKYALY